MDSYDDAQRVQRVTAEARNPPARLTIIETPAAVIVTNELGQSRTFHPNGREEAIAVDGLSIPATSTRDREKLVVVYRLGQEREVRHTYAYSPESSQLVVEVQFLQRGAGDRARRVYERSVAAETPMTSGQPPPPPPSASRPVETFDQRPGAEFKGLKQLGIVVENLSEQAAACGLNAGRLEAALAKQLTDRGFTVRKNSDEDTYLYVSIMTTSVPDGSCVSRYDVFVYSSATATLSYRDQPVLVQASLMHRGGIGSSAPAAHAAAVAGALGRYVDVFITQVQDANK
jgi:hypothetical protein